MLLVQFRFLAGRYHGTPWGSHVNEGAIDWPPSPWRVLRALVATGFARLGWNEIPAQARDVIRDLAESLPSVHLPPANAAHTRHYMPLYDGTTTKVIDTFAHVGDGPLVYGWPLDWTDEKVAFFDSLLQHVPYLGRAESWVEVDRTQEVPRGLLACVAGETCPGPNLERVSLLCPELPERYLNWRQKAVDSEKMGALTELRMDAERKGKAPPKTLGKKELSQIEETFPVDIVDATLADTRTLRARGWSQPPGTRWVSFWRPLRSLRAAPEPPVLSRTNRKLPTAALLALASDTKRGQALPPLRDALWRLEAIHDALVSRSDRNDGRGPSPVLAGKAGGRPLEGHRHATLVPLTLHANCGRLDHIFVFAPMGFDDAAQAALQELSRTWAKNFPDIFVTLAGMGDRDDFAKIVPATRSSSVWQTVTPFVPPRHLKPKGKDRMDEQVQAELERRGLPRADRITFLPEQRIEFRKFRRERRDAKRPPPVTFATGLRLEFSQPVQGPINLGYESHFGLGCFLPVE